MLAGWFGERWWMDAEYYFTSGALRPPNGVTGRVDVGTSKRMFFDPRKGVILSKAPRRPFARPTAYGAEPKDPGNSPHPAARVFQPPELATPDSYDQSRVQKPCTDLGDGSCYSARKDVPVTIKYVPQLILFSSSVAETLRAAGVREESPGSFGSRRSHELRGASARDDGSVLGGVNMSG